MAQAHGGLHWLTYALRHDPETIVDLQDRPDAANATLSSPEMQNMLMLHLPPPDVGNLVRVLRVLLHATSVNATYAVE